jgi:hypothetical protein
MDARTIIKKERIILLVNLIVGVALLATGILIKSFTYNKALVGLSFIPFALAISSFVKIVIVKKNPEAFVEEYDERIVAAKNRADALSLRIIRYILMLCFFFYTFTRPKEIFESLAWWLLLSLYFLALFLPHIILGNIDKNFKPDNNE